MGNTGSVNVAHVDVDTFLVSAVVAVVVSAAAVAWSAAGCFFRTNGTFTAVSAVLSLDAGVVDRSRSGGDRGGTLNSVVRYRKSIFGAELARKYANFFGSTSLAPPTPPPLLLPPVDCGLVRSSLASLVPVLAPPSSVSGLASLVGIRGSLTAGPDRAAAGLSVSVRPGRSFGNTSVLSRDVSPSSVEVVAYRGGCAGRDILRLYTCLNF